MSFIDEQVVKMTFDNDGFEKGVADTITSLEKLNQSVENLGSGSASSAIESIQHSLSRINFDSLNNAIETVNDRFSTMGIAAARVIENIADKVESLGEKLVNALTVKSVEIGFGEYEQVMNITKVIMSNTTASAEEVQAAVKDLQSYADKTIFNYNDLTGVFGNWVTMAGSLEQSGKNIEDAVEGLANLIAMSGKGTGEFSRLGQASSKVFSQGYMSRMIMMQFVRNGTLSKSFKDAIEPAVKKVGDYEKYLRAMAASNGDIITSLNAQVAKGDANWLTSDVYLEILSTFQNKNTELGKNASAAAELVSTPSTLGQVTYEAIATGISDAFKSIFGDYEEVTETLTSLSDMLNGENGILSGFFGSIGDFFSRWHELGGRDDLFSGLFDAFEGLRNVVESVSTVFQNFFPGLSPEDLSDLTNGFANGASRFKDWTENLRASFGDYMRWDYWLEEVKTSTPEEKRIEGEEDAIISTFLQEIQSRFGSEISNYLNQFNDTEYVKTVKDKSEAGYHYATDESKIASVYKKISNDATFGAFMKYWTNPTETNLKDLNDLFYEDGVKNEDHWNQLEHDTAEAMAYIELLKELGHDGNEILQEVRDNLAITTTEYKEGRYYEFHRDPRLIEAQEAGWQQQDVKDALGGIFSILAIVRDVLDSIYTNIVDPMITRITSGAFMSALEIIGNIGEHLFNIYTKISESGAIDGFFSKIYEFLTNNTDLTSFFTDLTISVMKLTDAFFGAIENVGSFIGMVTESDAFKTVTAVLSEVWSFISPFISNNLKTGGVIGGLLGGLKGALTGFFTGGPLGMIIGAFTGATTGAAKGGLFGVLIDVIKYLENNGPKVKVVLGQIWDIVSGLFGSFMSGFSESGFFSGIGNVFTDIKNAIADIKINGKDPLDAIFGFLNSESVQTGIETLKEKVAGFGTWLGAKLKWIKDNIVDVVLDIKESWDNFATTNTENPFVKFFNWIQEAPVIGDIIAYWKMVGGAILEIIGALIDGFSQGGLSGAIDSLGEAKGKGFLDTWNSLFGDFLVWGKKFKESDTFGMIKQGFFDLGSGLRSFVSLLSNGTITGIITDVFTLVGKLGGALLGGIFGKKTDFSEGVESTEQSFATGLQGIKERLEAFINGEGFATLQQKLHDLGEMLNNFIGDTAEKFSEKFPGVIEAFQKLIDLVTDTNFYKTLSNLKDIVLDIISAFTVGLTGNAIPDAGGDIATTLENISEAVSNFKKDDKYKTILDFFKDVGEFIAGIPEFIGNISKNISTIFEQDSVPNIVLEGISSILAPPKNAEVTDSLSEELEPAKAGIFGAVGNFIGELGSSFLRMFTGSEVSAAELLPGEIGEALGEAADIYVDSVDGAVGTLKEVNKRVMKDGGGAGTKLQMSEGITVYYKGAQDAVQQAADASNAINDNVDTAKEGMEGAETLIDKTAEVADKVNENAGKAETATQSVTLFSKLSNGFGVFVKIISGLGTALAAGGGIAAIVGIISLAKGLITVTSIIGNYNFLIIAKVIKAMATVLAVSVASIIGLAYAMSQIENGDARVDKAMSYVAQLTALIGIFATAMVAIKTIFEKGGINAEVKVTNPLEILKNFFSKIAEGVSNLISKIGTIGILITIIGGIVILIEAVRNLADIEPETLNSITKLVGTVAGILGAVAVLVTLIGSAFNNGNAQGINVNANLNPITYAAPILMIAYSVKMIIDAFSELVNVLNDENVSSGSIAKAAGVVGGLTVIMSIVAVVLAYFATKSSGSILSGAIGSTTTGISSNIIGVAVALFAITAGVSQIVEAIVTLYDAMKDEKGVISASNIGFISATIGMLAVLMISIGGAIALMQAGNKGGPTDIKFGASAAMIAMVLAIKGLIDAVADLAKIYHTGLEKHTMSIGNIISSIVTIIGLMYGMGVSIDKMDNAGIKLGTSFAMVAMVLAIKGLLGEIKSLAEYYMENSDSMDKIVSIVLSIGTVLLNLYTLGGTASKIKTKQGEGSGFWTSVGVAIVVAAVAGLIAMIKDLASQLTTGELDKYTIAFGAVEALLWSLVGITAATKAVGKSESSSWKGIGEIAKTVIGLIGVISVIFGSIGWIINSFSDVKSEAEGGEGWESWGGALANIFEGLGEGLLTAAGFIGKLAAKFKEGAMITDADTVADSMEAIGAGSERLEAAILSISPENLSKMKKILDMFGNITSSISTYATIAYSSGTGANVFTQLGDDIKGFATGFVTFATTLASIDSAIKETYNIDEFSKEKLNKYMKFIETLLGLDFDASNWKVSATGKTQFSGMSTNFMHLKTGIIAFITMCNAIDDELAKMGDGAEINDFDKYVNFVAKLSTIDVQNSKSSNWFYDAGVNLGELGTGLQTFITSTTGLKDNKDFEYVISTLKTLRDNFGKENPTQIYTYLKNAGDGLKSFMDSINTSFHKNENDYGYSYYADENFDEKKLETIKTVMNLFSNFTSFIKAANGLKEDGVNLILGLIDGILSKIGELTVLGAKTAFNFEKGVIEESDISSPSVVMFGLGVYMIQGLLDGIEAMMDPIESAGKTVFDVFAESFTNATDNITAPVKTLGNKLLTTFDKEGRLNKLFGNISEKVKGSNIIDKLTGSDGKELINQWKKENGIDLDAEAFELRSVKQKRKTDRTIQVRKKEKEATDSVTEAIDQYTKSYEEATAQIDEMMNMTDDELYEAMLSGELNGNIGGVNANGWIDPSYTENGAWSWFKSLFKGNEENSKRYNIENLMTDLQNGIVHSAEELIESGMTKLGINKVISGDVFEDFFTNSEFAQMFTNSDVLADLLKSSKDMPDFISKLQEQLQSLDFTGFDFNGLISGLENFSDTAHYMGGDDNTNSLLKAVDKILGKLDEDGNYIEDMTSGMTSMLGEVGNVSNVLNSSGIAGLDTDKYNDLIDKLSSGEIGIDEFTSAMSDLNTGASSVSDSVSDLTTAVKKTEPAVDPKITDLAYRVIRGEFGNNPDRQALLEQAGYSYEVIQNEVNRLLGNGFRYQTTQEQLNRTLDALGGATVTNTITTGDIYDATKTAMKVALADLEKSVENIEDEDKKALAYDYIETTKKMLETGSISQEDMTNSLNKLESYAVKLIDNVQDEQTITKLQEGLTEEQQKISDSFGKHLESQGYVNRLMAMQAKRAGIDITTDKYKTAIETAVKKVGDYDKYSRAMESANGNIVDAITKQYAGSDADWFTDEVWVETIRQWGNNELNEFKNELLSDMIEYYPNETTNENLVIEPVSKDDIQYIKDVSEELPTTQEAINDLMQDLNYANGHLDKSDYNVALERIQNVYDSAKKLAEKQGYTLASTKVQKAMKEAENIADIAERGISSMEELESGGRGGELNRKFYGAKSDLKDSLNGTLAELATEWPELSENINQIRELADANNYKEAFKQLSKFSKKLEGKATALGGRETHNIENELLKAESRLESGAEGRAGAPLTNASKGLQELIYGLDSQADGTLNKTKKIEETVDSINNLTARSSANLDKNTETALKQMRSIEHVSERADTSEAWNTYNDKVKESYTFTKQALNKLETEYNKNNAKMETAAIKTGKSYIDKFEDMTKSASKINQTTFDSAEDQDRITKNKVKQMREVLRGFTKECGDEYVSASNMARKAISTIGEDDLEGMTNAFRVIKKNVSDEVNNKVDEYSNLQDKLKHIEDNIQMGRSDVALTELNELNGQIQNLSDTLMENIDEAHVETAKVIQEVYDSSGNLISKIYSDGTEVFENLKQESKELADTMISEYKRTSEETSELYSNAGKKHLDKYAKDVAGGGEGNVADLQNALHMARTANDEVVNGLTSINEDLTSHKGKLASEYVEHFSSLNELIRESIKSGDKENQKVTAERVKDYLKNFKNSVGEGFEGYEGAVNQALGELEEGSLFRAYKWTRRVESTLKDEIEREVNQCDDATVYLNQAAQELVNGNYNYARGLIGQAYDVIEDHQQKLKSHFEESKEMAESSVKEIIDDNMIIYKSEAESLDELDKKFYEAGKSSSKEFVKGMKDGLDEQGVTGVAEEVVKASSDALGVASPSTKFFAMGEYCMMGFLNGFTKYFGSVQDASGELGDAAMQGLSEMQSYFTKLGDWMESDEENPIDKFFAQFDTLYDLFTNKWRAMEQGEGMEIHPRVSPVLEMDGQQADLGQLMTGEAILTVNGVQIAGIDRIYDLMEKSINTSMNNTQEIVAAIKSTKEDIASLEKAISSMKVTLDKKKIVGEIYSDINTLIGVGEKRKARGVF